MTTEELERYKRMEEMQEKNMRLSKELLESVKQLHDIVVKDSDDFSKKLEKLKKLREKKG